MGYRKPLTYIPPYNYCDRRCTRCAIDKTRCLVYQVEMDERLHREIDGVGESSPGDPVTQVLLNTRTAMRLVEEQARAAGVDWRSGAAEPIPVAPRPQTLDPLVERAAAAGRAAAGFMRDHGRDFPPEVETLRHHFSLPAVKLGRATLEAADDYDLADRILSAQVAHKALGEIYDALESIRRQRPSLGDAMLDLLAEIQSLRGQIERRWLSVPCRLLVPVEGAEWWGPLRDVTDALKRLSH
jgi:hypothetical protein